MPSDGGGRLTRGGKICLGNSEHRWTARARPRAAELGGRHAGVPLEGVGEVALVVEARGGGDLGQSHFRVAQLTHARVQTQLADVLADRAAVVPAKHSRQVGGMHSGDLRELLETEVFVEVRVQVVVRAEQPARRRSRPAFQLIPNGERDDLQHQPFGQEG